MNGYGEFSWPDGKKYIGWYEDDKKSGFGIFYWPDSKKVYVGFWENGKQHGYGTLINKNSFKFGFWENGIKKNSFHALWQIEKLIANSAENGYLKFFEMEYDTIVKFISDDS